MVKLNDKNVIELGTPKVISRGRCKYGVFIDTETCNMDKMIFDFSGKVINLKTGAIKEEFSFVIEDTYKTRNIITGQFSRKKRKDYPKLLRNGSYKMITRQELVDFLQELFTTYKIDVVGAFNIAFDLQALYNTLTYTNNRMKYFKKPIIQELEELEFFKVDMLDLWAFASIIFHSKEYKAWYIQKGYKLTPKGCMKTGVEMLCRFLKENTFFKELHKGQADLDNEHLIFIASCLMRNNKKMLVNVSGLKAVSTLAKPQRAKTNSKTYQMFIKQTLVSC